MITQTTNGNGNHPAPQAPGEWSLAQIEAALSRQLPASMLESKTIKGQKIPFISWTTAAKILSKYAPGWQWRVIEIKAYGGRLFLIGELSIPTSDGMTTRQASGTETLQELDRDGNWREISYGDPSSNAESMAFRRAAAKFGLGLYLY